MHRSSGPAPAQGLELDELDHQVLDLLDELDCGDAWIAAKCADATASAGGAEQLLEAALESAGESRERVEAAVTRARPLLARLVAQVAASVVDAAVSLADTEDRGRLEPDRVAELRRRLDEQPQLALGLGWATELTRELLGLDRDAIASTLLDELSSLDEALDEVLADTAAVIGERLEAARGPSHEGGALSLRVFRSASVAIAGPSLRAASLASEHPEQLALALRLVQLHSDPQTLVAAFDRAIASIDPPADPLELVDGPKRKFTIVHAILAAIVLGLTLWHYVWR